ncbi:MAG: hypothetical protein U5K31_02730 [Balneolaceae bacterium]|nr:hypothetical protein [Balneolaceae bacterium]
MNSPNPLYGLALDTWFLHVPSSGKEKLIHKKLNYLMNPFGYAVKKSKVNGIGPQFLQLFLGELLYEFCHQPRFLLKDPLALVSADWFSEVLDFQVVVTIRNPLGFVGSLRESGMGF